MVAEKTKTEEVNEIRARIRRLNMSPRKVRLVTDLIKGLSVAEALTQLRFIAKRAAAPVTKLLQSGIANAEHNHEIEPNRLFVKDLTVDEGPTAVRYRARAQGRAFPIHRRTSHVNLVLGVSDRPVSDEKLPELPEKKATPKADEKAEPPQEQAAEKKEAEQDRPKSSGFKFWKRKTDTEDKGQQKEDVKGKRQQQTFDRRGNM